MNEIDWINDESQILINWGSGNACNHKTAENEHTYCINLIPSLFHNIWNLRQKSNFYPIFFLLIFEKKNWICEDDILFTQQSLNQFFLPQNKIFFKLIWNEMTRLTQTRISVWIIATLSFGELINLIKIISFFLCCSLSPCFLFVHYILSNFFFIFSPFSSKVYFFFVLKKCTILNAATRSIG